MPERLGTWPFEIGLWVGKAATPNRMGRKGDNDQNDGAREDEPVQEQQPPRGANPA